MILSNHWTPAPGGPLEDKGRSAWRGDHLKVGQLGKFKELIDAGEIEPGSVLVIENLDRLSRQKVRFARRWIEEVTEAGISVAVASLNKVFTEESLSGENILDLMQYLMEAQRAHAESERRSSFRQKVNEGHIEKAKRGEIITARAPAWLVGNDGKWYPSPDRAPIVQQIYEWSADGLGYAAICKKLNATYEPWTRGWKTDRAEWKIGYVRDILHSPSVEGEYHRKAAGEDRIEVITGYYPRVVAAELVEQARAAKRARLKTGGRYAPEGRNLFTGLMTCGSCGGTMAKIVNLNQRGSRYYYIICRAARGGSCENNVQFRYDKFEEAAVREILYLSLDSKHFTKTEETSPIIARIADLRKQIELEQRKLDSLVAMVEDGLDSRTVATKIAQREDSVARAEADLAKAEAALQLARGQVSPADHIKRVMEVREAITSDDPETGQQARRMVRTAFQNVIESIRFKSAKVGHRKYTRLIAMRLVGGHFMVWFDGNGNVVKKRDHLEVFANEPDSAFSRILRYGVADDAVEVLASQVRRSQPIEI